jgi:hypothetical protein
MSFEKRKGNNGEQNGPDWYEIQVEGHIDPCWFNYLEGWRVNSLENGTTLLAGPVVDQPVLHGLLARIRDLNLKIIYLKRRLDKID